MMNLKSNIQTSSHHKHDQAGLFRRLLAIAYDCFLLIALLFLTTALFTAINRGNAIERDDIIYIPLVITLAAIAFLFFTWFWTHGGQTLGLKTWKLRVINIDGGNISWKQALIRLTVAILSMAFFGIGFIWSIFHKQRKTWHDLLSESELIDCRYVDVNRQPKHDDESADPTQQND